MGLKLVERLGMVKQEFWKGGMPTRRSYRTTPTDHQSAAAAAGTKKKKGSRKGLVWVIQERLETGGRP